MQSCSVMLELSSVAGVDDVPLDFGEFLGRRLGVETGKALSLLGSFLITFEPLAGTRAHRSAERTEAPAAFHP